jgi:hypothetical protein
MLSTTKHSWYDSSIKSIKDELVDCEISSLQTNHIDYTIIDAEIDPLYSKTSHSEKSNVKTKKKEPPKREFLFRFFFYFIRKDINKGSVFSFCFKVTVCYALR